ncbi:MAG: AAA family ATPase [Dysgonamonadaceae bacterium]|jgi:predicted cytidylate kinase|nr:AAA family ATPase [Dysgonamonadaceae bacterium]
MHISITGDLGSGKSTVAKELCKILNYNYLSTGLIQRQLGQERGMNTLEFNKFTEEHREIDEYIDQKLIDINNKQTESSVLDSRLAWHFVNQSFKVYLMAADEVAAYRVFKDEQRIGEPSAIDLTDKMNDQKERLKIENNRFEKIYGIKPSLFRDFDVVIDTSSASVSDVTNLILTLYQKFEKQEKFNKLWLSPHRIYPTENIQLITTDITKKVIDNVKNLEFNIQAPVSCVLYNKDFFVFDGHEKLSACLNNNIPLIPVLLLAKNSESVSSSLTVDQFVRDSFNINWIYDWENAHHFRFFHYPAIN